MGKKKQTLRVDVAPDERERLRELLDEALATLTARQRLIMELHWGLRGERALSVRETARVLGVAPSTVQTQYERVLPRLAALEILEGVVQTPISMKGDPDDDPLAPLAPYKRGSWSKPHLMGRPYGGHRYSPKPDEEHDDGSWRGRLESLRPVGLDKRPARLSRELKDALALIEHEQRLAEREVRDRGGRRINGPCGCKRCRARRERRSQRIGSLTRDEGSRAFQFPGRAGSRPGRSLRLPRRSS